MRASLFRSSGVSLLVLGLLGCGDGGSVAHDGGAGKGGEGGKGAQGGKGAEGGGGTAGGGSLVDGGAAGSGGAAGGGGAAGVGGAGTAGAGGGAKDAGASLDFGGITPPASLTVTIKNRRATTFELVWTAPSINGLAVTGYQVRYAKVPITSANVDDTTVTTAIPNNNTPKATGTTEGMEVQLYIENSYYFAVEGANPAGTRSAVDATTTPVAAHFNVTTLPSTSGTNEEFGFSVSGDGDLNGDGLSDILVGTSQGGKAYLFLGSANFSAGAPAVVFSGASAGFGFAVAQIGDIDNDGLPDLAISDATSAERVYIYKGRQAWPMTLTDAQADYVISTDATYAGTV